MGFGLKILTFGLGSSVLKEFEFLTTFHLHSPWGFNQNCMYSKGNKYCNLAAEIFVWDITKSMKSVILMLCEK